MSRPVLEAKITIEGAPDPNLELVTTRLRRDIADLDVESVRVARADTVPYGAKAGDPLAWGQLLIAFGASGGVLTMVIALLQDWLRRNTQRTVTVEIGGDKLTLSGVSTQDRQRLIEAFIARHTKV